MLLFCSWCGLDITGSRADKKSCSSVCKSKIRGKVISENRKRNMERLMELVPTVCARCGDKEGKVLKPSPANALRVASFDGEAWLKESGSELLCFECSKKGKLC